jgi:hypothetical protein
MLGEFKVQALGDLLLPLLDELVGELLDLSAPDADQVVMVIAAIQLEDRIAAFEMMPFHEARRFELREHPIHGREAYFLSLGQQKLVYFFRRQMTISVTPFFEHLQNLDPRQGDFQASVSDILGFHIEPSAKTDCKSDSAARESYTCR